MFVRRLASIVFFVMCFMFVASSLVLAQGGQGNETNAPAVVENKIEAPAAPVTPSEPAAQATEAVAPAAQASEAVTPAAPEAPPVTPAVTASPEATSAPEANAEKAQAAAVSAPANEKKTEWVWGEVVSVDPAGKQIVIKHLDYESYEEVQTTLIINEKTLFENVTDLTGIKAGDHITVDYNVEGKNNIADLVVVEKGEAAPAPEASVKEKSAETPAENINMTATPESAKSVAPETVTPEAATPGTTTPEVATAPAAANQTTAVNTTATSAQ